ncbi:hypothetical protein HPB50_002294 [Hyalomma asiaticum]|uniref:Uncharacterized protein n=1 Tax=Hyalomma asiaticum TaxID=266040 RepID=A0ACB7RNV3_HYAAI|nr:hypothetical protein HPB50_002294 [Hyalomma asiaticum]
MAQSAVSNTYEVTEAIIISVAARAARRKLVDFPPTPWLPRMRRRRRLRYSATSQDSGDWTLEELCRGVPPAEQSGDEQALEP